VKLKSKLFEITAWTALRLFITNAGAEGKNQQQQQQQKMKK
jgi:hypothetical protein